MSHGTLTDTYVAALQHGLVELPDETTRVGVVRRPTPWFHGVVDENVPDLGPPSDLLEEAKAATERLADGGYDDTEAHNEAWRQVDFEQRYRTHLWEASDASAATARLRERLDGGESIALVCYENTDEKRCHRTILRERLEGV